MRCDFIPLPLLSILVVNMWPYVIFYTNRLDFSVNVSKLSWQFTSKFDVEAMLTFLSPVVGHYIGICKVKNNIFILVSNNVHCE